MKFFSPPEWDADVPEESTHVNLTHKSKIRKRSKEQGIPEVTSTDVARDNSKIFDQEKTSETLLATGVKKQSKKRKIEDNFTADTDHESKTSKKHKPNKTVIDSIPPNKSTKSLDLKSKSKQKAIKKETNKILKPKHKPLLKFSNIQQEIGDILSGNLPQKNKKKSKVQDSTSTKISKTPVDVNEKKLSISKNAIKKMNKVSNAVKPAESFEKPIKEFEKRNENTPVSAKTLKNRKRRSKKNKNGDNVSLNVVSEQENNASQNKNEKNSSTPSKAVSNSYTKKLSNMLNAQVAITDVSSKQENNISKNTNEISNNQSKVVLNSYAKKLRDMLSAQVPVTDASNHPPDPETPKEVKKNTKNDKKTRLLKPLRQRMIERLKGARFRYLNEQMYIKESNDAQQLFKDDPKAFQAYHDGYRQQVNKWPLNPLDLIIKDISNMPKEYVIADLGCGDGRLGKTVQNKVHSFDLVSLDPSVKACDMSHTPLLTAEVNVVVFCLSLMGTNLKEYILEANRILKIGGILKVAEVESRFENIESFLKDVQKYGFSLIKSDLNRNLFYFMDFKKEKDIKKRNKLPELNLKPCYYKKR